jgi:hypothetical protein
MDNIFESLKTFIFDKSEWDNLEIVPSNYSMKGRKHTEETKLKMSLTRKGKPKSAEHIKKMSECKKGKHPSLESRKKMSAAKKGVIPWNKGKKLEAHSDEYKKRMSDIIAKSWEKRKLKNG